MCETNYFDYDYNHIIYVAKMWCPWDSDAQFHCLYGCHK